MWGPFSSQDGPWRSKNRIFAPCARVHRTSKSLLHRPSCGNIWPNIAPFSEKSEVNTTKALNLYFSMGYLVSELLSSSQRYVPITVGYSTRGSRHRKNAPDFAQNPKNPEGAHLRALIFFWGHLHPYMSEKPFSRAFRIYHGYPPQRAAKK